MWGTSQTGRAKMCHCKNKQRKKKSTHSHKVEPIDITPAVIEPQENFEELFKLHPGDESLDFFCVPQGTLPKAALPKKELWELVE